MLWAMRGPRAATSRLPKAFTLVELLVVVAIISLLLMMTAPVLQKAMRLTRSAVCGSNLHQIGTALQSYVAKWAWYPVGIDQHTINEQRVWLWPPQLRVYTGDAKVMRCPQAPDFVPYAGAMVPTLWTPKYGSGLPAYYGYKDDEVRILGMYQKFSYGYNVWGANIGVVPNPGLGVYRAHASYGETRADRVVLPQDMVAFVDSCLSDYWSGFSGIYRVGQYPSGIHGGCANFLFCDSHVELLARETMMDINDPAVNCRWNVDHERH